MTFEQKITEAKSRQRHLVIKAALVLLAVLLFCVLVFFSPDQFRHNTDSELSGQTDQPETIPAAQSQSVPDEQLRQNYLDAFSEFENTLKPELDKTDLAVWNQARAEQLALLKDKALSAFTAGDYANAANDMGALNQLAKTTLSQTRQAFEQALSKAQTAYQSDHYDEATVHIAQVLMLDKSADSAIALAAKIDNMPAILKLLDQINTTRVENKPGKELQLIEDLLKIAPHRTSAVNRKQALVNSIRQSKFNSAIARSYQALKRGDVASAQQTISTAKRIFPQHQKIGDVSMALQALVKKQRLDRHQQAIQQAVTADDWVTVQQQARLALQERGDDTRIQQSLSQATAIVALTDTLDESLKHPYRLSNQQLVAKLNSALAKTNQFSALSPSLSKKAEQLSTIIQQVNHKIQVEVRSDNQTTILVRGVGVIGKTQLKTLRLQPGQYTFEGKRKGFKSKLLKVLIPYDQNSFQIDIRCDEPI